MSRQWWLLTRRNADVLFRNRLTLAILLGSPVLVTVMMATLFQPGAFDPGGAADVGPAQIVFWIAFAGFFFGLTYGLLQIVGEMAVFRRERLRRAERRRLRGIQGHRAAAGACRGERGACSACCGCSVGFPPSDGTCTPCCS